MLSHLTITDLALVDRVELPLGPGLNVLTGETGAGKSVLVGALSIVLGGRGSAEVVREGATQAVVEALFDVPAGSRLAARLEAHGIETGDGQLVVRRSISRAGRGRVHLNGQLATVSMLAEILGGIVELTGQHEHVSLLDVDQHAEYLDGFGGHGAMRSEVSAAHARVRALSTELEDLERAAAERARREDYLRFALDEIEAVDPEANELEGLEAERRRHRNLSDLLEGVGQVEDALGATEGALGELLSRCTGRLERLARLDPELDGLRSDALELQAAAEELASGLERYRHSLEVDPGRRAEVESRVAALRRLCRKYGPDEAAVLVQRDEMRAELDGLEGNGARQGNLRAELEGARGELEVAAARLSAGRAAAASKLAKAIGSELTALSMAGTRVEVALTPLAECGPRGAEAVELRLSPNPGEPLKPLRRCASGGELSRVLLAIKGVLAAQGAVRSHVFDEVDTGIGGRVAEVVGAKLKGVARDAQVIAVTHLPQVAAYADQHVRVHKVVEQGRTLTRIRTLDEGERVEELARMVGGLEITDRTIGLAQELRDRGRASPGTDRRAARKADKKPKAATRTAKRAKANSRRRLQAVP